MINFCTLFDSNYLTRGLALNDSLRSVCPSYHLYIVAFDRNCYEYLSNARLPNVTPVLLQDFEDQQLLAVKPSRSTAEYCWTCTPSVILYCLEKFGLPSCTYIDADMIFYHDPAVLLDEMGACSILISEHRYTKEYAASAATHGIYCVQFMCFRQDENGMKALTWWRERCLEWCYARLEDGKFGDQKYLDDWTTRFEGVHVMQHPGGGIAPWNLQQYLFTSKGQEIFVRYAKTGQSYPLIFFHFHGLRLYTDRKASCCAALYDIDKNTRATVYLPYLKKLSDTERRLKKEGISFNPTEARRPAPRKWQVFAAYIKELIVLSLRGKVSPFRLKNYNFSRHYHFYDLDSINQ
jgi:hypothetical protein